MRRLSLLFSALLCVSGCKLFLERAPDYAVNAMDSTANRSTDLVLDKAEDSVRNPSRDEKEEEAPAGEKVTRRLDDDDVLIKQGDDYLVGKKIGDKVLIVRTGAKVDASGNEVIPVRRAKKGDLKAGKDAFFTTAKGDVRRAAWTPGTVTDDGTLSEGTVGIGPEADILWDGQVCVKR